MELAIYLLNNAIARERLIINSKGRMYLGGGKWSYKSIHLSDYPSWKQAQDIILQQKVNPRVELIFLWYVLIHGISLCNFALRCLLFIMPFFFLLLLIQRKIDSLDGFNLLLFEYYLLSLVLLLLLLLVCCSYCWWSSTHHHHFAIGCEWLLLVNLWPWATQ